MEYIIGIVFTMIAGFFCYMTCHINEEHRVGKYIPLPWE